MINNFTEPVKNIRNCLGEYIVKNNLRSLVIGISGGIDSALCCVLAKPVCDRLRIPLIGRSIIIESNKEDEIRRAANIGRKFCTDFRETDLTQYYKLLIPMFLLEGADDNESEDAKIRYGNIKARMRMLYLYDLAQRHKGLVLSTDNKTEFMVGFWTLHGDVGDFGMIQSLWKREVYGMSEYLAKTMVDEEDTYSAFKECIDAIPTDGLGITSCDLDQLMVNSYEEADEILISYIEMGNKSYESHPIIGRHKRTIYKRGNPYNIPREYILGLGEEEHES